MATYGLSLPNTSQALHKKFSYKNMQALMDYLATFNCESQVLAEDGTNHENIQTTGTKMVMINGQPCYLAADAELDISADTTESTLTAWATATSYSVGDVRSNKGLRYRCIVAHTSRDNSSSDYIANEPGNSDNWAKYWVQYPHGAVNAAGTVITTAYEQWFLVTAQKDGTLNVWVAGSQALSTTGAECKVPQFDPKLYCPIGFIHVANASGSDFTVGTTAFNTGSVTTTYTNITGPIFPHPDNWDAN